MFRQFARFRHKDFSTFHAIVSLWASGQVLSIVAGSFSEIISFAFVSFLVSLSFSLSFFLISLNIITIQGKNNNM